MLRLAPHPEGGWYREVYRARRRVETTPQAPRRCAVTQIYYLLRGGEHSRWHRIDADEVWHFYQGTGLTLVTIDRRDRRVVKTRLGPPGRGHRPLAVVGAGRWQAASVERGYALVGCTVAPGFTFDRFELLAENRRARTGLGKVLGRFSRLL
ncbi:MAG: cupin domain-containing protein [Deltaproteobacteria bacterium]|nr:cupin domain-containing protein [Deltaproteobacteria bacterium]